jgi:uncharacterized BrkB/YihY/UPF0761 family membrane protein
MLRGLWRKFDRDWGWNLARLLAYTCLQGLFAVLGLELIVLSLVLRVVGPSGAQRLIPAVMRLLPDRVTVAAVTSFDRSLRHASLLVLLVGLPIALWYGTRFFVVLESCLSVIFRRRQRPFLQQNAVALLMLLLFAVLLPVILLSATMLPSVELTNATAQSIGALQLHDDNIFGTLGVGAGLAANFLLLLLAYTHVTPEGVSLRAAWPGALLGASLTQLYLMGFPLYVHFILQPDHFGTVAGFVLVLLVFFFAYSVCIVIGAEVAALREGIHALPHSVSAILAQAGEAAPAVAPPDHSPADTSPLGLPPLRPVPPPVWREPQR